MRKETVVHYISDDNERFKTKEACLTHEKFISLKDDILEKINTFLKNSENYKDYYENLRYKVEIYNPHVDNFVRCYIYYLDETNGCKYEVEEDFEINVEKWEKLVKEIEEEFGFILTLPNYYI